MITKQFRILFLCIQHIFSRELVSLICLLWLRDNVVKGEHTNFVLFYTLIVFIASVCVCVSVWVYLNISLHCSIPLLYSTLTLLNVYLHRCVYLPFHYLFIFGICSHCVNDYQSCYSIFYVLCGIVFNGVKGDDAFLRNYSLLIPNP